MYQNSVTKTNRLAVLSLIIGIIGLGSIFCYQNLLITMIWAYIAGAFSLILGTSSLSLIQSKNQKGWRLAITSIVIGSSELLLAVVILFVGIGLLFGPVLSQ